MRENTEKILGSEKKRKSAENFHVWTWKKNEKIYLLISLQN